MKIRWVLLLLGKKRKELKKDPIFQGSGVGGGPTSLISIRKLKILWCCLNWFDTVGEPLELVRHDQYPLYIFSFFQESQNNVHFIQSLNK